MLQTHVDIASIVWPCRCVDFTLNPRQVCTPAVHKASVQDLSCCSFGNLLQELGGRKLAGTCCWGLHSSLRLPRGRAHKSPALRIASQAVFRGVHMKDAVHYTHNNRLDFVCRDAAYMCEAQSRPKRSGKLTQKAPTLCKHLPVPTSCIVYSQYQKLGIYAAYAAYICHAKMVSPVRY